MKKLINRHYSKELRIYSVKSKSDLISIINQVLTKELPEDINEVLQFGFNFDSSLPLLNSDFFVNYKGLENSEEYRERLIKEEASKNEKLKLLIELAKEFEYKLEKNIE